MLFQIWLVRIAVVVLGLLCIVFGFLTARKGLTCMRDRDIDGMIGGPMASDFGAYGLAMGAFVCFFGFGLLYMLTMF